MACGAVLDDTKRVDCTIMHRRMASCSTSVMEVCMTLITSFTQGFSVKYYILGLNRPDLYTFQVDDKLQLDAEY